MIALAPDLEARGVRSKAWVTKNGAHVGGVRLRPGALYYLLSNPVYRGAIRHGDKLYPDAHPPIIDESLWEAVQARLAGNCPDHPDTPLTPAPVLLGGLVTDDRGTPMAPIHTKRGDRRYRYYASIAAKRGQPAGSLPRLAAGVLEEFLVRRLSPALSAGWAPDQPLGARVRTALLNVTVGAERIVARLKPSATVVSPRLDGATCERQDSALEVAFPIRLRHRQGTTIISTPGEPALAQGPDRALVRALCLARNWADLLARGDAGSLKELARAEGYCTHYAARLAPLAYLAPDLAQQILDGRQPRAISLGALTKQSLPMGWDEQRGVFAEFA